MQAIKQSLTKKYGFSNYEVAQLEFLFKTFASEISKMLIMAILFHNQITVFLFALFVMLIVRSTTGGIHFDTYLKCLAGSTLYLWLAIVLLPHITLPLALRILLCVLCALNCWHIGLVSSPNRLEPTETFRKQCKAIITAFLIIYACLLYIMPESQYIIAGFWVIILHSLQLLAAKYKRKENT